MSSTGSLFPLEGDQRHGAMPRDNVWLSASAGTGKTQVLTARVLRLLLSGVRPEAILGLTFTKAGAAEMAQRVRRVLAEWVQLKATDLSKQIYAIGGDNNDPEVIARARTLFAKVIDAPGQGLAFQTIHSFCQSLLGAFPLESGLPPGFRAIEEREAVLLRREVLNGLAEMARHDGDGWFLDGLGALAERLGEGAALGWIDRCAAAAPDLLALPSEIAPWLRSAMSLPGSDPDEWLARQCAEADARAWGDIRAEYIAWGTATGEKMAAIIGDWLATDPVTRAATLDRLIGTVCTAKGELRADFTKKLIAVADLAERCAAAALNARQTAAAMRAADRLALALRVGRHFAGAWSARKQREGLVDFDDLIRHTLALLDGEGRAEWIRYKLDSRIDHILVDEAQDTNAAQWRIVARLTEEYFAGEGARDPALRTLFVVGDYKQAIYGFQGTDPRFFAAAEQRFRELGEAAQRPFARLAIDTNYRSEPEILTVVDAVARQLGPEQLGLDPEIIVQHRAPQTRRGSSGQVVLWPTVSASPSREDDDEEGWIDDATREVAQRIARQVRRWIDDGLDGSPVAPGDVLVLVRKRKELAGLIVARLQALGVPVAGVDRLALHRPLAVQDLLSAARFAVQPLDDLNLASLLVSPLIGFTQEELWRFSIRAKDRDLWQHLRSHDELTERLQPLRDMLAMADFVAPYRFFETLLSGPLQGRAKLLARLGNAARDPLDELLNAALTVGMRDGPSLQHFLTWFDSGQIELKRETDVAASEARVMTVHGAKGLEARLVILADAAGNPDSAGRDEAIDWTLPDEARVIPVTGIRKEERPAALTDAYAEKAARDREEHWRLLYVAMTRARERLFVTGALAVRDQGEPAAESWYAVIRDALAGLGAQDRIEPIWAHSLAYPAIAKPARTEPKQAQPRVALTLPDWVHRAPPAEPRPPRPLAPSRLGDDEALAVPLPPGGSSRAAQRGTLIHALFERLPAVRGDRQAAALRWLAVQGATFSAAEQVEMAAAALAVLDDPAHAAFFGADSLGEVPFSALVDGRVIAGTADRLLVTEGAVTVVDFKTGAQVPERAEDVPTPYLKQMAAYAASLAVIFPERSVHAALLYTGGPRLLVVPPALLARHRPGE
jgi:ATP-dependent helicase/nuclease subunit A